MSFDNYLGVMSDGVYNESGDVYLRFESMGLIGSLGSIPVPPVGGDGVVAGGSDVGMSPLSYWERVKLRSMKVQPWRDSTTDREDQFMEEFDDPGDEEPPATGRKKKD